MNNVTAQSLSAEEITELVDLVKKIHGFDFSEYSKASLKRRLTRIMMMKKLAFYDLKHMLVNDPGFFQDFLEEITVNVTEMFRDPSFYKARLTGRCCPIFLPISTLKYGRPDAHRAKRPIRWLY